MNRINYYLMLNQFVSFTCLGQHYLFHEHYHYLHSQRFTNSFYLLSIRLKDFYSSTSR
jgi:hypothetical protein